MKDSIKNTITAVVLAGSLMTAPVTLALGATASPIVAQTASDDLPCQGERGNPIR